MRLLSVMAASVALAGASVRTNVQEKRPSLAASEHAVCLPMITHIARLEAAGRDHDLLYAVDYVTSSEAKSFLESCMPGMIIAVPLEGRVETVLYMHGH